ncbi:hypothetical protein C8Q80DRAFT_1098436, partial [Daedaleopsis nitida]
IPYFPMDRTVVRMYTDGLWGYHEFTHWPQRLSDNFWLHACIPLCSAGDDRDTIPENVWAILKPEVDWHRASIPGLGFFRPDIRNALRVAAFNALERLDKYALITSAFQVELCCTHVQCLCLEVAETQVFHHDLLPCLNTGLDYSHSILPVLGAYTSDEDTVRLCARVGLSVWFPILSDQGVAGS